MTTRPLAALGLLVGVIAGCASGNYPSTYPAPPMGTAQADFISANPAAMPVGNRRIGGHDVTMFQYRYRPNRTREDVWYVFSDGKLVRWGDEDDWPTAEELANSGR